MDTRAAELGTEYRVVQAIMTPTSPEGRWLWESVTDRIGRHGVADQAILFDRHGKPQLILPRRGQGEFRLLVTDIYRRRCAVTQERTLPALEAAHIRPFGDGGEHKPQNGLLLRRDIHRLFDTGYVTITPDLNFEVRPANSRRIRKRQGLLFLAGQTDRHSSPPRPTARSQRALMAQRALLPVDKARGDDG